MHDNENTKTPVDESVSESTVDEEFDLDTYRQNLNNTDPEPDTQLTELQNFIKEQNQVINTLRSDMAELKKVNFALANNQSEHYAKPMSAETILNDVFFGKEK